MSMDIGREYVNQMNIRNWWSQKDENDELVIIKKMVLNEKIKMLKQRHWKYGVQSGLVWDDGEE